MPRKVPQAELDAVLRAVSRFPDGASLEDIRNVLEISLPRRTLQRRLAMLVAQQRLIGEGRGPGSRYRLPQRGTRVGPAPGRVSVAGRAPGVETYVPVPPEGDVVKKPVHEPIPNR
jgi:hypothetical protein